MLCCAPMTARVASLLLLCLLACGEKESPVKPQPPSQAARLAAQACACTTLACLRPLQAQLEQIATAQHADGNVTADNAEAKARVAQCASRLGP